MNQIWILALLALLLSPAALRAEEEEVKPPSPKQVSQEMAEVWCVKMDECSKTKEMTVKECQKILFSSFKKGFERVPKDKPLMVERNVLDQCKETISQGTCDSLKGAKALPSCEFISLLGAVGP